MTPKTRSFIPILAGGLLLVLATQALAEKVIYVIDGDTLILDNHERVRLIGINAPEIASKYHRGERYGKEAKKYLRKRVEGQEVTLKPGAEPFDKYERRLAYVYLPDGTFINEELVKLGYAETFRKFPFTYKERFLALEAEAKEKRLGMWGARKRPWWLKGFIRKREQ
jgi:micrococcal nuclease